MTTLALTVLSGGFFVAGYMGGILRGWKEYEKLDRGDNNSRTAD